MTEQQYIDATNLAKLRIMLSILRDTLAIRGEEEHVQTAIMRLLRQWTDYLEPIVSRMPPETGTGGDRVTGVDMTITPFVGYYPMLQ